MFSDFLNNPAVLVAVSLVLQPVVSDVYTWFRDEIKRRI